MSAADRMVVRTRDGSYRSFPRRTALGMISRGQATAATATAPQAAPADVDPLGPHGDEYQAPVATEAQDRYKHPLDGYDPVDLLPEFQVERGPVVYPTLDEPVSGEPDDDAPTVEAVELPEPPRGNASRQEWADYAQDHLGIEVTSAMSRTTIREAVQEQLQSLARLPQPALPGGRLDTPEDEPVTEESVTDDEDPGTR